MNTRTAKQIAENYFGPDYITRKRLQADIEAYGKAIREERDTVIGVLFRELSMRVLSSSLDREIISCELCKHETPKGTKKVEHEPSCILHYEFLSGQEWLAAERAQEERDHGVG